MEIKKVLPYFIVKINNEKDFRIKQMDLFLRGYMWLNGSEFLSNYMVKFPVYISNLPWKHYTKQDYSKRRRFNQFNNNILYLEKNIEEFNLIKLRSEKIKQLNRL